LNAHFGGHFFLPKILIITSICATILNTTQEINMANKQSSSLNLEKGVGYYNTDNRNKKDKTLTTDNGLSIYSSGIEADASLVEVPLESPLDLANGEGALPSMSVAARAPTPLDADQVKSCVFQLFDNGEGSTQRYKYKLRLNLTDGTNPEFIASLTKDLRNFKKHIPGPNRERIIEVAMAERKRIKKLTSNWPYIGKLHLNPGFGAHRKTIQVEPDTLVVVWWDPEERGWSGAVMLQNWVHEFDLFENFLTAKQKSQGVRAQDSWKNPKYDKTVRPQTWAQKRGLV